tara:strand:+ start:139 stop:384 length:246 start_codon:yes stop_codon:yes gene_type:complete
MKYKNTWQQLKPHYQMKIRQAAHKFTSAKRLKYTLMASDGWYDLRLDTIRDILIFTDKHSYDISGADVMYGVEFLKIEDND